MTKIEEINALTQFVAGLPKASYLRPWLESVLPEVAQAIRNDLMPTCTVAQVRGESCDLIAVGRKVAAELRNHAATQADKIIADAQKQAANTIAGARHRLQTALDGLPRA